MKKTFYLTALLFGLSACSESSPPVKIETFDRVNPIFKVKYTEVKVTAISDEIEVENIVVNRGNCKMEGKKLPKILKFGESVSVSFSTPCSASEVEIVTNDGNWTMNY